jgi:pyruvate-ferredoxin/flavodoxin oxidoreductase
MKDYAYNETRFKMLTQTKPQEAERLIALAQQDVNDRWRMYQQLASLDYSA